MNTTKILFILTISVILSIPSNGERTKDKMYEMIESTAACFRRLNATHQTGCTSKSPGSVGVIHVIHNDTDLNFVLKNGPVPPYIPIIAIDQLNHNLINKFARSPNRVAGLVLHRNVTRPTSFSQELSCPNAKSNIPGTCEKKPWNPYGTALMHANIPFPVFLVQDESNLAKIIDCFEKFNNYDLESQSMRSLCALQLSAFMFATNDSKTCIRRSNSVTTFTPTRFCDPLGSRNVWASIPPRVNKTEVILVTAQLDTTTMFYDVTPGAVAPLTGLVTLMTTAHILKQMVKNETFDKTIMFVLFNGESYDYIGSQRFVYDVVNKAFPMKKNDEIKNQVPQLSLSDIRLIVELGQINKNSVRNLFTHHVNGQTAAINNFKQLLQKNAQKYKINTPKATIDNRIPPASLHSFLRENKTLEGIVITTDDDQYSNHYYHSIYDDNSNIDYEYENYTADSIQRYLSDVSKTLAMTLYQELSGNTYNEKLEDPVDIVDELLHCYLDTGNCSLYQAVTVRDSISDRPFPLYVSVDPQGHRMTTITSYVLAWLTGDTLNKTKDNCNTDPHNPVYQYFWMSKSLKDINDTACIRTTMNYSIAISPAFIIDDYDWTSNRYSTWTESVWHDIYMRMFLVPSNRHEIMTISVGTVTFVLSLALVYFVHTRADILFAKPDAMPPGTSC